MPFDEQINQNNAPGPIFWWNWRPGIRPQNALLIGIPFAFIALLMTTFGLITLIAGIEDNMSPPALDYAGHHYLLPGTTAAGNPASSIALLLVGLLLLPYPALLTHWGWQDLLIERYKQDKRATLIAQVVDKRATNTTRTARPGLTGRGSRPWYGLALLPLDEHTARRHIYTFSVNEETWARTRQDARVKIVYAPHLQYVYSLHVEEA